MNGECEVSNTSRIRVLGCGDRSDGRAEGGNVRGTPIGVEVRFGFVEQEERGLVAEKQTKADSVDQLMFAVGQGLAVDFVADAALDHLEVLETHDPLVGGGHGDLLVHVEAV